MSGVSLLTAAKTHGLNNEDVVREFPLDVCSSPHFAGFDTEIINPLTEPDCILVLMLQDEYCNCAREIPLLTSFVLGRLQRF